MQKSVLTKILSFILVVLSILGMLTMLIEEFYSIELLNGVLKLKFSGLQVLGTEAGAYLAVFGIAGGAGLVSLFVNNKKSNMLVNCILIVLLIVTFALVLTAPLRAHFELKGSDFSEELFLLTL